MSQNRRFRKGRQGAQTSCAETARRWQLHGPKVEVVNLLDCVQATRKESFVRGATRNRIFENDADDDDPKAALLFTKTLNHPFELLRSDQLAHISLSPIGFKYFP